MEELEPEPESTKEAQERITFTISLREYLLSIKSKGIDYITIDKTRADEIRSQEGWNKVVYIEEIIDSTCYRLFDIDDWIHRETNIPEIRDEKRAENYKKAREEHSLLLKWKIASRGILINKAHVDSVKADKYIAGCISPESIVKKESYIDVEGMLDENSYHKALKFYYDLRVKLKYPFIT